MKDFEQHTFFLTSHGCALAATCVVPATVRGAVLMITPFAEERKGTLPVFMQTARVLAKDGIASLRFDFAGCGDSEGDFGTTPPAHFDADCDAALAWLSSAFPAAPIAVLGARTGALQAIRLAAKQPTVNALILWSPVTGLDFVRQLLQRRMVNDMVAYGKAQESRASLDERLRKGETIDLDGYAISGSFYAWAQTLVVQPATVPTFLVAGGHDEKTMTTCAEQAQRSERADLRFPPFWNTVGHVDLTQLISQTRAWLVSRLSHAVFPIALTDFSSDTAFAQFLSLGEVPNCLRVIADTPEGNPCAGVLFLHGWSGDRTGPHRLFVRFARRLAQDGFLCFRPDFYGRGLSDGEAADASIARMTENAQSALDALKQRLPPNTPLVVVAICSGCKVALSLAAKRQDISKLVLWSAESMGSLRSSATGLRKTLNALSSYARKLLRPETWKKIISGKVQTRLVTQALVKHETRTAEEARSEDAALKLFRSFRNPILFVFGGSDPDATGSSRAYAAYCRANKIPFIAHTVAHAGHSYYGEEWTRELLNVSQRFLKP